MVLQVQGWEACSQIAKGQGKPRFQINFIDLEAYHAVLMLVCLLSISRVLPTAVYGGLVNDQPALARLPPESRDFSVTLRVTFVGHPRDSIKSVLAAVSPSLKPVVELKISSSI